MKKQAWPWVALAAAGAAAGTLLFLYRTGSPPAAPAPLVLRLPSASAPTKVETTSMPAPAIVPAAGDYRSEIAALRRRGMAESSIQEIITKELLDHRRREQYRTELSVEQGRYAPHYWETPPPIETTADLERARQKALAQLDQEVAAQLQDLFGPAAALPPAASPFFGPDHPGPKIDFLSSASRQRLEETLFSQDPDGRMSAVDRLSLARQVLTPDEFDLYAKWNSPAAVSLGSELVGFGASQPEYDAIYRWQTVADSEEGFASEEARTEADNQLKVALGPDRYAAFAHRQDPAFQTVVQMLNRWGLPAASADTVLSLRQSAISAMTAIWRDPNVPDEQKAALVEKTRQQYRQQITAQLGLPPGLVPDDDLL